MCLRLSLKFICFIVSISIKMFEEQELIREFSAQSRTALSVFTNVIVTLPMPISE